MTEPREDPFTKLKAIAREGWALFAPLEAATILPAARLVRFAGVRGGDAVLDLACGTGVVAVTAARAGAKARGLDLSPALLERARLNASTAHVAIDFVEGDAESLPYPTASFDVVLSQFGHIFAPRPEVALGEMLRVLKPGGRLAFSSWPPEHFVGQMFARIAASMAGPSGAPVPAPPQAWGDPNVVRARLGEAVTEVVFDRDVMTVPALSPIHTRHVLETTLGPLKQLVARLEGDAARLAQLRSELDALIAEAFADNQVRQHYLLTRATKR